MAHCYQLKKRLKYQMQYGNSIQTSIFEVMKIINALSFTYSIPRKSIASMNRGQLWTTSIMYQNFGNDMQSLRPNQSLVFNSSHFYGLDNPFLLDYGIIGLPMSICFELIHQSIGSYDNIDLRWISPPNELVKAVVTFRNTVFQNLVANDEFYNAYRAMNSINLPVTPLKWQDLNLLFLGGSPLCGNGLPLSFVQRSFGFDDACSAQERLDIKLAPLSALFAAMMLNGNISSLCLNVDQDVFIICTESIGAIESVYTILSKIIPNFPVLNTSVLDELNFTHLQFVQNASGNTTLDQQFLLYDSWSVVGYITIFEWVSMQREAISFEGDNGTFNLISYAYTKQEMTKLSPSAASIGYYFWYGSATTTTVLVVIATIVILLGLKTRSSTWCLFFHRIASSVWLSRWTICVRSMTAASCLATAPMSTGMPRDQLYILVNSTRTPLISLILSGEVAWITYVVHDMLLPLTGHRTRMYAVLSSNLAWLIVAIIDIWWPVETSITIDRNCNLVAMFFQVTCSSATISVGHWTRFVLIYAVNIATVVLSYYIALIAMTVKSSMPAALLVPASATAYLCDVDITKDQATAALCGIFSVVKRRRACWFDTKLWMYVSNNGPMKLHTQTHVSAVVPCVIDIEKAHLVTTKLNNLLLDTFVPVGILLLGFSYLASSLSGNIAYLTVVNTTLTNDYGWAGFNATGMLAFLMNTMNRCLIVSQSGHVALDSPAMSDISQLYNGTNTRITWYSAAPRVELYRPNTPIKVAIANLRSTNPCKLPWAFTQYCWLDFNRTWSMAATESRAQRCLNAFHSNGAVYLESGLRNLQNMDTWSFCWGYSFDIGIKRHLMTSDRGRKWLNLVFQSKLSIDDEVLYWKALSIDSFVLQWQNYKIAGLTDAISVTSTLGTTYSLKASESFGEYQLELQTSYKMYWGFASDLWAITSNKTSVIGKSLLRESPNFAFLNMTRQSLLLQNNTLIAPLNAGFESLISTIGPFGVIDMIFIPLPKSLTELYGLFMNRTMSLLGTNLSAQIEFLALVPSINVIEIPSIWLDENELSIVGGNLLCGSDLTPELASSGLAVPFSIRGPCHASFSESLNASPMEQLFACLSILEESWFDAEAICNLNANPLNDCPRVLLQYIKFLMAHNQTYFNFKSIVDTAIKDLNDINVRFTQFVLNTTSNITTVETISIMNPNDQPWRFYGWCLVYEWIIGSREVVSFQGDLGTLTTLSALTNSPLSLVPDPTQIPWSFSFFCKFGILYMTLVLIGLSIAILASALYHQGNMEGINLLVFNRVASTVWVGRSFVLLRSLSAVWLLNTSVLDLHLFNRVTLLTSKSRVWYETLLAASELTWIVYVINDLASCFTLQYTTIYAFKSTNMTWFVAFWWIYFWPHKYSAIIDRNCIAIDMDFQLICNSGKLVIGSISRIGIALCLCLSSCFLCYCYDRYRCPKLTCLSIPTLLLNAQSFYMLQFRNWRIGNDYYLDKTSAIMAGLLIIQWNHQLYILDIKTWRVFLDLSQLDVQGRFKHAIALARIHTT
ncbi:hypothetical protein THRCLA_03621 [Thraustotheca clavata]|uniref:Uncharacterized protein n=1 Tax=Thraustotheca clavata TaxID=74557 RepID=A0A1W0A1G4_9STRA|nr:hypothetical protein THRCLA_03621 [Thraustotheca clavata]